MRGGGRRRLLALAVALAALAVGCDAATPSPSGDAVDLRAEQAGWVLEVTVPSKTLDSVDAIDLRTTLTWTGPAAKATIWGSGMGPVGFSYEEVGGAGRTINGAYTADCVGHDFVAGQALAVPPGKNVVIDGGDPNRAFYDAWRLDPALHLPAGSWKVVITADGYLAPCDIEAPELKLSIPLELTMR